MNSYKLRHATESDLPMLHEWWQVYGGEMPHAEALPPDTVILYKDQEPQAAASLYIAQGAPMALYGWQCINPNCCIMEKSRAFEALTSAVEELARLRGVKIILASLGRKSMARRLKKRGYEVGDESAVHVLKRL